MRWLNSARSGTLPSTGRYGKRARATSPYLALSVLMLAAVWGVRTLLLGHVALWVVLIAEIVAGGAVYVGLAMLFRPEGWREGAAHSGAGTGRTVPPVARRCGGPPPKWQSETDIVSYCRSWHAV